MTWVSFLIDVLQELPYGKDLRGFKAVSTMRRSKILLRPDGDNPGGIDGGVAGVIVHFDMLKTDGFCHAGHLI